MDAQRNSDLEHLRLLSIFHYVVAGLIFLFSLMFLIYVAIGLVVLLAPQGMSSESGEPPPAWFGWLFFGLGAFFILIAWTIAGLVLAAGRCLAGRNRRIFCMVIAGLLCLWFPLGAVLGVFTLIVLCRPSVRDLFEGAAAGVTPARPVAGSIASAAAVAQTKKPPRRVAFLRRRIA